MPPLETPRYSQARLGQSVVGSVFLSPGSWCAQGLCPPRICFPVLCKLWQLYGGVNGDLLQEALCQTQVCCTQSPCPCGSPLLTRTSTGGTQTQFCLSLCGVSGSWCAQDSFEPSEYLWQVWGLILNVIWRLLPSCCVFSFALGCPLSFSGGIQHSPVNVQQRVVILEFLQEKLSTCPSTPPSWVMLLLFNMLSRSVITFLPGSKCLFISWVQSPSAVILETKQ